VKEATSFNITKYIDPRAATSDPYVKGQIAAIAKLKTDVRAGRADPKAAYKYMVDFAKTYASSQPTREWAAEQARKEQYERQDQAAARRESMTRESWSRSDAQRQAQQEHADRLREHAQGSRTQEQDNANQLKAYQLQYRELDGAYNKANADVNYYEKQEQDIYPKLVNLKGDSQEYIRLRQLADSYMELKNSAIARRDELLKQREAVKEQIIGNLTGKAETQQQPQGGIPQVKSEEDYNALPQGSEYIAPDGTHRRKK
jgi:hypothetical protein